MRRSLLVGLLTSSVALAQSPPKAAKVPTPSALGAVKSPDDNPTTPAKVALGRALFFDARLSKDGSMSCESCHHIDKAYTSGKALDAKVGGAMNKRNAMSMLNLGYFSSYYWDGRMPTLEAVSAAAWKGQLGADPAAVAAKLNEVPKYKAMFDEAFGTTGGATADDVPRALAAFFRALVSPQTPWDRFMAGDKKALSKDAQAGWATFQKAGCVGCHVPPLFSDSDFHSLGIGDDAGRKDATKAEEDTNKFRTPSLRNVALTAPYFHDGHAATLEDAIALMAKGGLKPGSDAKLKPFALTPKDVAHVKAFLEALTGPASFEQAPELP